MKIKTAIEKAIKGGWKSELSEGFGNECGAYFNEGLYHFLPAEIFLDPKFWETLGKSEGWNEEDPEIERICVLEGNCHIKKMHRFIDHLADGKNIETAFDEATTN